MRSHSRAILFSWRQRPHNRRGERPREALNRWATLVPTGRPASPWTCWAARGLMNREWAAGSCHPAQHKPRGADRGDRSMACSNCGKKHSGGLCVWCGHGSDRPAQTTFAGNSLATPSARGVWSKLFRVIASVLSGLLSLTLGTGKALREISRIQEHGKINAVLVCPHCQATGSVRSKPVDRKTGISGGKIAAAVLLSPLTLIATGLSRNERATQAHCDRCGSTWTF